jgi:hypothetical protein
VPDGDGGHVAMHQAWPHMLKSPAWAELQADAASSLWRAPLGQKWNRLAELLDARGMLRARHTLGLPMRDDEDPILDSKEIHQAYDLTMANLLDKSNQKKTKTKTRKKRRNETSQKARNSVFACGFLYNPSCSGAFFFLFSFSFFLRCPKKCKDKEKVKKKQNKKN